MSQTPHDDEPDTTGPSDPTPAEPGSRTDYPAAPAPGQHEGTHPDLGAASAAPAGATGVTPSDDAAPPADPEVEPTRRRPIVRAAVAVGILLVLVAVFFGARAIFGAGVDEPGDDAATTGAEQPTSEDPSSEEPAPGCTSDLCTEAETLVSDTHIGGDEVVWTLDGTWADAVDTPDEATGSGTAAYVSDEGEVTLTLVGFASADEAADYAESVMADLGEPDSTRPVWDDPQEDRGEGEMSTFTVDGRRTLVWYDDAGVVSVLEGSASTEPTTVGQFYFTMPAI